MQQYAVESITFQSLSQETSRIQVPSANDDNLVTLLQEWCVRPGELVEIRGPSASGKSQLALYLSFLQLQSNHRVLYLDVDGGFCIQRLLDLLLSAGLSETQVQSSLKAFEIVTIRDFEHAICQLRLLRNSDTLKNVSLLVLDSLTQLVSAEVLRLRCGNEYSSIVPMVKALSGSLTRLFALQPMGILITAPMQNLLGPLWMRQCHARLLMHRLECAQDVFTLKPDCLPLGIRMTLSKKRFHYAKSQEQV